ncbi:MAG TPA: alpha/beta hydrolase-fold protein [Micromonosporaceae bacterium]
MRLAEPGGPWWDVPLASGWVVALFALAAIGVSIAAGITWDVERYKRLRRSLLLVAMQLFSVLTLAASANLAGGFYGSLADLLGVRHAATAELNADAGRPVADVEPWLAEARAKVRPGHGVWAQTTIAGARTGYKLPAWVYVPDAYFDPSQPNRRFPVSILLAGFPGAPQNWERQGHMVAVLDRLMASGRIPPMILVSVSQNPNPKRDSECVDAVGGARADTYISEDVPDALARHFRVMPNRTAWSLMGYSTGGYCAVDLALRHPDRFGSAVSLDGYFAPAVDASTGDLFRKNVALQRSYTPALTVRNRRAVPLRFYLMVGDAERAAKTAGREFAASVHAPDTVTLVDIPGGHNWGTWTSALPGALSWLAADFADPALTGPVTGGRAAQGGN